MLSRLLESCRRLLSQRVRGMGRCDKCTCTGYEDAGTGNDYCKCGHSYSDHW